METICVRVGYDSDEFCRVRDGDGGDGNANAIVDETLIQKTSIGRSVEGRLRSRSVGPPVVCVMVVVYVYVT